MLPVVQAITTRLKAMRRAAGMSQSRLGVALDPGRTEGAAQRWVSERERGVVPITVEDAEAWASTCGHEFAVLTAVRGSGAAEALELLAGLRAEEVEVVLLLARALPRMEGAPRHMLLEMLRSAARPASTKVG